MVCAANKKAHLEATDDPNIASIKIISSEITGTPIVVSGSIIDFGTLYFMQDSVNPSIGTLELNRGWVNIKTGRGTDQIFCNA